MRRLSLHAHGCGSRLLVGYEVDLITPAEGSDRFWGAYGDIHSFLPRGLAMAAEERELRAEFYSLCTRHLSELHRDGAGLIELLAVEQSRDRVIFLSPDGEAVRGNALN